MKTIGKVLFFVLFVTLLFSGCGKQDGVKGEMANNEIKAVNPLGPAGKLVQSFFKNWEFKRYKQMHAQTVHSRDADIFVKRMEGTPIEWRNLKILSEEQSGSDWDVNVSVDVTNVTCMFAACMVNLQFPKDKNSDMPDFHLSPSFLGIQKFMTMNQKWKIIGLDGEYFIDMGAMGSKVKREDNVMNYVLDAGSLADFPMELGPNREDQIILKASMWLAFVCLDLAIPKEDTEGILIKSKPLYETAKKNLKELAEKIRSLSPKKPSY